MIVIVVNVLMFNFMLNGFKFCLSFIKFWWLCLVSCWWWVVYYLFLGWSIFLVIIGMVFFIMLLVKLCNVNVV